MKLSVTKTVGDVTVTRTFEDSKTSLVTDLTAMPEIYRAAYVKAFSQSVRNMLLALENPEDKSEI